MDLLENPFYIIGASPSDNRRRILELADERSLLADSNDCMEARAKLTNPRKRLSAEIAWMPGVGSDRQKALLSLLQSSPSSLVNEKGLPELAKANILAAAISQSGVDPELAVNVIVEIAEQFEDVEPEDLMETINSDRVPAGFPEVTDISTIEAELKDQRRYLLQAVKNVLDSFLPEKLVKAVAEVVEQATSQGENHCPVLIVDLIDAYELEAQGFFTQEEENIGVLLKKVEEDARAGKDDSLIKARIKKVENVLVNWARLAYPIQLCYNSLGLEHAASDLISGQIREMATKLYVEHHNIDMCLCLINILKPNFKALDRLSASIAEDAQAANEVKAALTIGTRSSAGRTINATGAVHRVNGETDNSWFTSCLAGLTNCFSGGCIILFKLMLLSIIVEIMKSCSGG